MFCYDALTKTEPRHLGVGLTPEEKEKQDNLARAGGVAFWVGGALGALITYAVMK